MKINNNMNIGEISYLYNLSDILNTQDYVKKNIFYPF